MGKRRGRGHKGSGAVERAEEHNRCGGLTVRQYKYISSLPNTSLDLQDSVETQDASTFIWEESSKAANAILVIYLRAEAEERKRTQVAGSL